MLRIGFMIVDKIGNLKIIFLIFLLFSVGYIMGNSLGKHMIQSMILHDNRYIFLLYRPANEYIFLFEKLSDMNELNRLSGYYSLLEYKKFDNKFIIERFNMENSLYIKRSLIWILSYSDDSSSVIEFFSSIYNDSSLGIKQEILRSVKRLDGDLFDKFIAEQGVDRSMLKSIK